MSRRLLLRAFALSLAFKIAMPAHTAEAAQKVVRLGFVDPGSPSTSPEFKDAFLERLHELGWIQGQNLVVESLWADNRIERLPGAMVDAVSRKIDVLVTYGTPAAIAAKNATSTIPIVDAEMGDPVGTRVVSSLARPGGNLTGSSLGWSEELAGKWLELLQEAVPSLSTVAVIADLDHAMNRDQAKRLELVAPTRGIKVEIINMSGPDTFARSFREARRKAQAVLVLADPNMTAHRQRIVALATGQRLPDMHVVREFVDAGGLMAYTPDFIVLFRRAADYVDKILRGAKPADLPIEQPTKFVLIVNLKTAKILGLKIPESILLRADEVIK